MSRITKRPNKTVLTPEGRIIELTQGQTCLIDEADYEQVKQYRWHAQEREGVYYAAATIKTQEGKTMLLPLHRFILGLLPSDKRRALHKNRNRLDNRRVNLAIATHNEVMFMRKKAPNTSSRFLGVYRHKSGRWQAYIVGDGYMNYLGLYESEVDAARAYNEMAVDFFGTAAKLNRRKVEPKQ